MKKQQFYFTRFETLKTSNNILKGGFSQAFYTTGGKASPIKLDLNITKNCHGGNMGCSNITAGCGSK